MSPDHLCEEGPAYREEIGIPFNIILSLSTLLIISYGIHLNGHFYLFRLIIRIFLWIYHLCSRLHHELFYWYFILHFNHHTGQKKTTMDSTQSRDHQTDQEILQVTFAPDIDALLTVRPLITFLHQNHFDDIFSFVTYVVNVTHIIPTFPNLPFTVSTLQISEAPILHQDKQLEEFLIREEHSHNFINQDLTFLQPSMVHETTTLENSISSASDSTEVSLNTVQEITQPQKEGNNSTQSSLEELFHDSTRTANI